MLKQSFSAQVSALMVFGVSASTLAPLATLNQPAIAAELFAQSGAGRLEVGTEIFVSQPDGKRIIFKPEETFEVTLETREAVRSDRGTVLIPRRTQIEGQFQPEDGGTQFVADRIIFPDGTERRLDARSPILDNRQDIGKGTNAGPIWQGALVGGAATAIISEIFDDVGIFKVLGGAGAGALAGWLIAGRGKKTEMMVIEPDEEIVLELDSPLLVSRRF